MTFTPDDQLNSFTREAWWVRLKTEHGEFVTVAALYVNGLGSRVVVYIPGDEDAFDPDDASQVEFIQKIDQPPGSEIK
jgi:hypothetical protein